MKSKNFKLLKYQKVMVRVYIPNIAIIRTGPKALVHPLKVVNQVHNATGIPYERMVNHDKNDTLALEAKYISIDMIKSYCDLTNTETAAIFGATNCTVNYARKRLFELMKKDEQLMKKYMEINENLP